MPVVVGMADTACPPNLLEVAEKLQAMGCATSLYILPGGEASKSGLLANCKIPRIDHVPINCKFLTCQPTWSREMAINADGGVYLLSENSNPDDPRLAAWLEKLPYLTLMSALELPGFETKVTGLPAVQKTVLEMEKVAESALRLKVRSQENAGLFSSKTRVLSVALPRDQQSCERMHGLILRAKEQVPDLYVFARTHPALANDDPNAFAEVRKLMARVMKIDLRTANESFSPAEQIMLAERSGGLFVCDWDSSMALHAAAKGIRCGVVPPADRDAATWVMRSPLIKARHAIPFLGLMPNGFRFEKMDPPKDPAAEIANVVMQG